MSQPPPDAPRPARRLAPRLILVAALAAGLAFLGLYLVPTVIRSAYAGTSWPFLNGVITGQEAHPPEFYLALWYRVLLVATILLIVGLPVLVWLWRQRARSLSRLRAWFEALPVTASADLLIAMVFLGLLSGTFEATILAIGHWFLQQPLEGWPATELFWMVPVTAIVGLLACAVLALGLGRLVGGRAWVNGATLTLLIAICVFALGRIARVGIHPVALGFLALGTAIALGRLATARPGGFRRTVRLGAGLGVIGVLAWAALMPLRAARYAQLADVPDDTGGGARPNILFLVWDTVRAKSLSLYGHTHETTPHLDRFARDATVFDQAITTAPWTLPAHVSMFTGRYHHEHSARRNRPLDTTHATLAEELSRRGYLTAGFVANPWVGRGMGLERGFQWYEDRQQVSAALVIRSWSISKNVVRWINRFRTTPGDPRRISAQSLNESLLSWVDEAGDRPFFAFMNWFDAHEPYLPPDDFGFEFSDGIPHYLWSYTQAVAYPSSVLGEMRDAYDSCIYYQDVQLGALLDAMEARGLLANTIVILTSDHGETLGEHQSNLLGHENNVYMDVLQIPLVIYLPPHLRNGAPGGSRTAVPASLADLPATILGRIARAIGGPGREQRRGEIAERTAGRLVDHGQAHGFGCTQAK